MQMFPTPDGFAAPYDADDEAIAGAIAATEREIFEDAVGSTEGNNLGREALEEQSLATDWDGQLVSDEEGFHRNLYGDDVPGPALQRELDAHEQLAQAHQHIDQLNGQIAQLAAHYDPNVRAATEEQRSQFQSDLIDIACDTARTDQLRAHLASQQEAIQGHQFNRVNASMAAAHKQYGRAFEDAYSAITALDANDPLSKSIGARVWSAADPGEALMELGSSDLVRGLGAGRRGAPPPFMEGTSYRGRGPSADAGFDADRLAEIRSGYGDQATEDAIFKAAIG